METCDVCDRQEKKEDIHKYSIKFTDYLLCKKCATEFNLIIKNQTK